MLQVLDPSAIRRWSRLAAETLGKAREEIDALNVFPVPDGDTGTNLYLTMLSAAEALDGLPGDADAATTWRTLAQGAMIGARGQLRSHRQPGAARSRRGAEGGRGLRRRPRAGPGQSRRTGPRGGVRPVEGTV